MLDVESARRNPFAPGLLQGQVALVTGGGTGIGKAAAVEMLELGAKVVIASRKPEHLEPTVEELRQKGDVIALPCDIREPAQVEALVARILDRHAKIDILVNNAGGQFPTPAMMLSVKGWDAVIRNNLNGTFYMTREVATRAMIPQQSGVIVNVIANIFRGFPGMVHTGAARAGVENLTKTLAVEWAAYDIRVNALAPGIIRSTGTNQYPQEIVDARVENTPQRRAGSVEECAHAIVYLASPAALFITGATLYLDGGASLWGDTFPIPPREDGLR
jgi:citronellol/citronellal dehydrogenase